MKKKFIKTPLVGVQVHGAKDVGTRTVNLLMGEHAGEYVRGDIMDANAVIQAFDELKGNVDNNHDSLEEIVDELHNLRDTTDQRFDTVQEKAEEETANRIQGDRTLDEKIDQKERESNERDNVLQQNIDTEKQERVNADTQLRNDLTAEVNRAKASENALSSDIHAEATKRENDDNTIKDNLNAEVTRATAKENEIKAEVDVINGDSTTEGSFRKAIADVVGAAPEAYDTLKEIADKLNSNDDLHTAINDAIATKATTVALNEEITRAKAAEAENKAEIAAEAARAKEVEGDNALAIQNEESRATTAETAINESLNTEIDRAKGQEAYLQNLVNAKADTTALDGAKAELDKKISDETTRATGVEATKASADDLTAEVTRAKQAEAAITSDVTEKLAQKADTTALDNYVLTTALNEQVGTLNAAIDTKQPKGNYLTEHQSLEEYAKKVELPTVPTKISQLTNDSNFITSADVDFTPYATTEALTTETTARTEALAALEAKVTANTSAIEDKQNAGNYIPYDESDTTFYKINRPLKYKDADKEFTFFDNKGYFLYLKNEAGYEFGVGSSIFLKNAYREVDLFTNSIAIRNSKTKFENVLIDESRIKLCNYNDSKRNVEIDNSGIVFGAYGDKKYCYINNEDDYVLFNKKIKVSDIITDATTDSSLNSVLSNKQDKITPTAELDLTSIDTADIESLRSIVKALATELNALGLIKLKSA